MPKNFWFDPPYKAKAGVQWKPGEARSYIPIITMDRPETVPAGGVVGKTVSVDGDKRVSFVIKGPQKHGKTTAGAK